MKNLTENQLADRWQNSPRTLQGWRQQGKGPRYLKIGSRVVYPLAEVEAYEAANLHVNTNGPLVDGRESGCVDDAEAVAGSLGDKEVSGSWNAHGSGPSRPKPQPAAPQRSGRRSRRQTSS
jgi:hypothetical protein